MESQFDDLLAQRVAIDSEQGSGANLISLGVVQHGFDQRALNQLEESLVEIARIFLTE